jgi:hypothetical protein
MRKVLGAEYMPDWVSRQQVYQVFQGQFAGNVKQRLAGLAEVLQNDYSEIGRNAG